MGRKGQVTIFVILGMIILVSGIIIYSLTSGPRTTKTNIDESPRVFIQNCVEDDFQILIENISMNGGSINPEFYHHYYGNNVQFLCYSGRPYELCSINVPNLEGSIEAELKVGIQDKVNSCFDELESSLKEKGYSVDLERKEIEVKLAPKRIKLIINNTLTIKKEDSKRFESFDLSFENNLYDIVGIAKSLVEWESLMGDANVQDFMSIYYDFEITKQRVGDEVKIYTIKDRKTEDFFQFASRSLVFPAGS